MSDLDRAVDTVIAACLGVAPGEDVLVVVDPETRDLGDALRDRAAAAGADAVVALMAEREANGSEPPAPVAAALAVADAFIAPTAKSLSHTRARKAASDAGARGATMPGVTTDMLARVMADGPARLTVGDGRLLAAAGPEGERLLEALRAHGDDGVNLAELGIGTNDRATLTGNVLEDEKILGTAHVAFGASAGIGGTVAVPIHLDVVVLDATLTAGGVAILDAGRLVVAT